MNEKATDSMTFRLPDELKRRFKGLLDAEGKNESAVLREYVERYVAEREEFVRSIAGMFGYTKTQFKEKRGSTSSNRVIQQGDDE
jgi:hypothetical protein